ncbi:MAG: D-glycero-beta-D-manno-heptose-7-phosphate kinase [Desulfobacteraceae bacterium 4572_130]|nr:MAG: D-glycero-beta-D-manno-heptose-7-phosphate kinase [Desulfobacteraceae bacterium 4572_130]
MSLNISVFKKIKVLVLGDLMIDEYLWGDVNKISPEAPVPVVAVKNKTYTLGGAGNVINNLVSMGALVTVIGTLGKDASGKQMLDKFKDLGVNIKGIVKEQDRPTTKKTRVIASNQQVLRIDREIKSKISLKTLKKFTDFMEQILCDMDIVLISDYDKGVVTKELIQKTVKLANKYKILTIADPKGLDFSKYKNLSMLTPNQKEAGLATGIEISSKKDLLRAAKKIMEQTAIKRLLITCGKHGMLVFDENFEPFKIKSKAKQVFDVSGAGDTVLAILGLGLAANKTFKQSADIANTAAGIVVTKLGTATTSINELKKALMEKTSD